MSFNYGANMTNDEVFECILKKNYHWVMNGKNYVAYEDLSHPHYLNVHICDGYLKIVGHNSLDSSYDETWYNFELTKDQLTKIEDKIGKYLEIQRIMAQNYAKERQREIKEYREAVLRKI